jgi:nicotinamide mononucleotide adenylyltransferase
MDMDAEILNKIKVNWIQAAYLKDHTPRLSGIYPWNAWVVLYM